MDYGHTMAKSLTLCSPNSALDLVSSILDLVATELVLQPVAQMAVEMTNIHIISVQQILFHVTTTTNKF